MKIKTYLSLLCAAAVIASAAGCKSEETVNNHSSASTSAAISPAWEETTSASSGQSETVLTETTSFAVTSETTSVTTAEMEVITGTSEALQTVEYTTSVTTTATAAPETTTAALTSETRLTENVPMVYVPGTDNIKVEIVEGNSFTEGTESITLKVSYIGDDEAFYADDHTQGVEFFITGENYLIENYADGKWNNVEFSNGKMYWNDIAYEISGRSQPTFKISLLDVDNEPLPDGYYRVVKNISGVDFYAEFEITESDPVIADENGSLTLKINKIETDRFVCELVFPYYYVYYVECDTSRYPDFCVGDNIEVEFSVMYEIDDSTFRVVVKDISPSSFELDPDLDYKPVIYLYPEQPEAVSVKLDYNGKLTLTDPEYRDGWTVTVYPDGTIVSDGKEYEYLFWEGKRAYELHADSGFCVSGEDTESFLREKLAYLGLNEKETADFLEFWLPFMENNNYNVITFVTDEYMDNAKLDIAPAPDTVIRVFMLFSASEIPVDIPAQTLEKASARSGFTVVEWGGGVY